MINCCQSKTEDRFMTIEIADRLIKLRKKHGLSQEELADKLGLSRQAVSKWERAEASPDTDNLICLAKLYGVSLDELLSTDEDVDTIVEEQVKKDEKNIKIDKSNDSIHITDDDGSSVHIEKGCVACVDKNGHKKEIRHPVRDKGSIIIDVIEGFLFLCTIVLYVLLGALLNMWVNGWIFLFVPGILCSIARCIYKKNPNKFNMAFLSCFVFFFVCMFIPGMSANLWHPMWVVFLAIPIYHAFFGSINKILGKKDDDEDFDEDDKKEKTEEAKE